MNEKRLLHLHDTFDKQCKTIKLKKFIENGNDQLKLKKKEDFKIPINIIAFIQNRIIEIDKN